MEQIAIEGIMVRSRCLRGRRAPEGETQKDQARRRDLDVFWIRLGKIWMDQAGREEVFVSSSNSTGGVLVGSRSTEFEDKPNKTKIEPKRAKLMRKPKMAKIEPKRTKLMRKPKRAQIRFCNIR